MRRILVIEDSFLARQSMLLSLREAGFAADGVARAEEARQALRLFRFDAAVLDLRLPDVRGTELLDELQAQHPMLPVVVVTGDDAVAGRLLRRVPVMPKPVRLQEFVSTIDTLSSGPVVRPDRA